MKNIFYYLLLLPTLLNAQYDYLDISVEINGQNSPVALAGGLNNPQFSAIDLDNNGVEDLVVYDKTGGICLTFINNGTAGQVEYSYAPAYQARFPQGGERFVKLRDFDKDGIPDVFFFARPTNYPNGGLGVLKGGYDSNNQIIFTPYDSTLTYDFGTQINQVLSFYSSDIPAIDDIDNDGDLDIVAFSDNFLYIRNMSWYRNMSVENGNGGTTLELELVHQCWGMVTETGTNNEVFMSSSIDTCPDNTFWQRSPRHAGSTLTAVDYNNDGIKDILMGDATINTINLLTNSLVNDTFLVVNQQTDFPNTDTTINIPTFPTVAFIDVNNDGKKDMLVSPTEQAFGESLTDSVVWYYQNIAAGNGIEPSFRQRDFLVGQMIDLGQDASPVFFDYNADGLLDILIGHYGYSQRDKTYRTGLTLLENTGTATQPSFTQITKDYEGWSSLQLLGMHPTVGDLDGDGDQDLILGLADGTLVYIENIAAANQTAQWATPIQNYATISIGRNAAPQLVDLDRDGDLDLAIGEYNRSIYYFENTGTATSPIFSATATTNRLGGIDTRILPVTSRRPSPCFLDIAGKYELLVGHQTGYPLHYKDVEPNIMGNYTKFDEGVEGLWTGTFTDLDAADINADGRLDLVIGNSRGGISFFSVDTNTVAIRQLNKATRQATFEVYPNPAQAEMTLDFAVANNQSLTVKYYNTLGQVAHQVILQEYKKNHQIKLPNMPQGLYFIQIEGYVTQSVFVMEN